MVQKNMPDSLTQLFEQYSIVTKIHGFEIQKSIKNLPGPEMIVFTPDL